MTRKPTQRGPILDPAPGLRQRQRSDGTWRLWWEPMADLRAAGAVVVEFDARKPAHATREAAKLHKLWSDRANGVAPPPSGGGRSINALIENYRQSLGFKKLPVTTQKRYGSDLRAIEAKWGPQPVAAFDRPVVAQWYESLHTEKGPFRAKSIFGQLRMLMGHAELRGWRAEGSNPCANVRIEAVMERHRVASWAEFDALLAAARRLRARDIRLALLLAWYGGQRQKDLWTALPGDFARVTVPGMARPVWVWSLIQSKRKRALPVPINPVLVPALRAQLRAAHSGPGPLIWDAATGVPFTRDSFFKRWDAVRTAAALDAPSLIGADPLQWRDLRRTFSNNARAGGASDSDAADVLGNTAASNAHLRRVYMAPQIITALRATSAIQRPDPATPNLPQRKKA